MTSTPVSARKSVPWSRERPHLVDKRMVVGVLFACRSFVPVLDPRRIDRCPHAKGETRNRATSLKILEMISEEDDE